ncbi:MAG: cytochrome c biogenesis protein CcmE [Deltaproteobacteria bacterium]|nr:cytochrome c biogenesis protein CcmE [Deltaproteobacteria bacterium]
MSATTANPSAQGTRRVFLVVTLLVAASALGFIAFGNMGENLVYYWDVGQLREAGDKAIGSTIRLGGVVKEGTVDWRPDESHLEFIITDGSQEVPVECSGAPPQMFREGIGVVVEGTMTPSGTFTSERLMVKHSNEYKAPEDGMSADERKQLYRTVEDL